MESMRNVMYYIIVDFVVSAPYEPFSTGSGAVYVYYGKRTVEEFMSQTRQKVGYILIDHTP